MKKVVASLLLGSIFLLAGCSAKVSEAEKTAVKQPLFAVAFSQSLTSLIASQRISPNSASRIMAYSYLASWQAFASAEKGAEVSDAASAGVYVAKELFFNIPIINADLNTLLMRYSKGVSTPEGVGFGKKVLDLASNDGYAEGIYRAPLPKSSGTFSWEPTGMSRLGFVDPLYGQVKGVTNLESCDIPAPDYIRIKNEVLELFDNFSYEQAGGEDVLFFLSGIGTPTPPGQLLGIASNLVSRLKLKEAEGLKFLSAVAVGEFDAGIAVWREKSQHMVARPESLYERLTGKKILLPRETPSHPSYPSGHSGFSGAMVELVERYFGKDTVLMLIAPEDLAAPGAVVKFNSPAELLARVNQSRVDAGFHYPVDVEAGAELGRCVGGKVFEYFEKGGKS